MIASFFPLIKQLAYSFTIGIVKEYKKTSTDMARIELASLYLKLIKLIRQECLNSTLIVFGIILFANLLTVVQVAILLYAPIALGSRIIIAVLLAVIFFLVPLAVVFRFFAEDRWIRMTKADEFISQALKNTKI